MTGPLPDHEVDFDRKGKVMCYALGVGPSEAKHFNPYDIDRKDIDLERVKREAPDALIVETLHGYHVINATEITSEYILDIKDLKCPSNAMRVYPHDDLKLVRPARRLCVKVAHIYEAMFPFQVVTMEYLPCSVPLKPGMYWRANDGIKLHGEERHAP